MYAFGFEREGRRANEPLKKSGFSGLLGSPFGGPGIGWSASSGSPWAGKTSTPLIVNDSVLPGTTAELRAVRHAEGAADDRDAGRAVGGGRVALRQTSCVQLLPPPVAGANFSSGISMRSVMPFSSEERIVAFAIGSVDGMTPPPQLLARLSESSLRLAFSAAGPSAASLARSLALFFVPFALGRILVARSVLR